MGTSDRKIPESVLPHPHILLAKLVVSQGESGPGSPINNAVHYHLLCGAAIDCLATRMGSLCDKLFVSLVHRTVVQWPGNNERTSNRVEQHEVDPFENEMKQISWQKKANEMIGPSSLSCLRSAHGSMYRSSNATSSWSRGETMLFIPRSHASRLFSAARPMSVTSHTHRSIIVDGICNRSSIVDLCYPVNWDLGLKDP